MASQDIKISACVVVYHEEKFLSRCLDSLREVVDEIILIHDGPCHDNTLLIGAKYDAKIIITSARVGNAEIIRPLSYDLAKGEWILQIDADEFLSLDLAQNLKNLINNSMVDGYEFVWPIFNGEKYVTKNWPHKLALFRKNKLSFLGIPQFQPEVKGKIVRSNLVLEHKSIYKNKMCQAFITKSVPWAKIQAQTYFQDFSTINKFNNFINDWPGKIKFRKNNPLLIIVPDFFLVFIRVFWSGLKANVINFLPALQSAFFSACYRATLNWYIFLIKYHFLKNKTEPCLACGHNFYKKFIFPVMGGDYQVLTCCQCGLGRAKPVNCPTVYQSKQVEDPSNIKLWQKFANESLFYLKKFVQQGKILDVGCGKGVFVKQALHQDFVAYGIDISQEDIAIGHNTLDLQQHIFLGDLSTYHFSNESFEAITYIHCLEHIKDISSELNLAYKLLKPGGYLYIELPNFYSLWRLLLTNRWYGLAPYGHVWQFSKQALVSFLKKSNFSVVKIITRRNLHHDVKLTIRGLMVLIIRLLATLLNRGDRLIVVARK